MAVGKGSSNQTNAIGIRSIFFNNCWRNGIVPVELPIELVRHMANLMEAAKGNAQVTVDLERQRVEDQDRANDYRREMMARVEKIDNNVMVLLNIKSAERGRR